MKRKLSPSDLYFDILRFIKLYSQTEDLNKAGILFLDLKYFFLVSKLSKFETLIQKRLYYYNLFGSSTFIIRINGN